MKLTYLILHTFLLSLFSSLGADTGCAYVGSNINFVRTETQKALGTDDLQLTRFHIYKALNAISKSKDQLGDCGCQDASERINEVSELLKSAAETTSLTNTRIFLRKALKNTVQGLEALRDHDLGQHESVFGTENLTVNTAHIENKEKLRPPPDEKVFKQKIDSALIHYTASIQIVFDTVNCTEARAFATEIYEHCEQELLRPDLSEGKKYYNLRTKKITAEALKQIGDCR